MRRDDAVLRFQQRIIRADRLGVDHVQSRRSHLSAIERVGNVLLVNELTAGVIDEDDAVLHLGDTRLGLTDASEADDADGLALQLDERIVPIAPVGVIRPVTCVYTIDSGCDSSKGWVSKPARCRQAQTSSR